MLPPPDLRGCVRRGYHGYHRASYVAPYCDIPCGIQIRMELTATRKAFEVRLGLTIGFITIAAGVTRPAGIARVNKDDGDTRPFRFVENERRQLAKRPIA